MFIANDMNLQSGPHTFTDDQGLPTVTIPGVQMISVYLQWQYQVYRWSVSTYSGNTRCTDDQCLPTVTIPGVQMISVYLQWQYQVLYTV